MKSSPPLCAPFPQIAGYTLSEQLYAGPRTAVYRAVAIATQQPVTLKVLRQQYPSLQEIVQLRNQYAIAKNLPGTGIAKPLSLEPFGHGYVLVMEDSGGVSLSQYLLETPLELAQILEIALQIAEILHHLHRHNIIHKDIKPANLLIHPDSKKIQLIDFSIASLLPKEIQEIQNPDALEGTLAYLAPEQTGRMNRAIDYRADFYALGVTLYELLARTLPFTAEDSLALLHCHIAREPQPVHCANPAIPVAVGNIVAKLMAKNAEERYQTALGLKHDLECCLNQWQTSGTIAEFELGERDLSDRFNIPEKLYGREPEVQTLLDAFDRVSGKEQGTGGANPEFSIQNSELVLVAGGSGIGKTAVIDEVRKPIVRQRGYFIKGKFDQFNRNIPLKAFVEALRNLIEQILCESDAQLENWKAKILEAVGENGQILIETLPELQQIIGEQPPAPELSGSAVQNRFNFLFQQFIQVFCAAEHPLALFLDDLQWADLASLQFLKLLMEDSRYLLVLGAYRDNEVSPTHPFCLSVEELKKERKTVNAIVLQPLDFKDTNAWVAETLHCRRELAQPLTQLIDRKTRGNPFFILQFLKVLHEEDYIRFNRELGYWECDIARVEALAVTDDVVEFMALQLRKLSPEARAVLKLAACIGNQFDLETLAIISEQTSSRVAASLWGAVRQGLIVPTNRIYKFFQSEEIESTREENIANPRYRFLHDRVQQAAYSLIPPSAKQQTHYRIGQRLQQSLSPTETEEKLFEIIGHLNIGKSLIIRSSERESLARLNLAAAQKARNSAAYSAAQNFVKAGIEFLDENCWNTQYELTLTLYCAATEVAYLNADLAEMESRAAQVLQSARCLLDKVKIYLIEIEALVARGKALNAIEVGVKALAELGVNLPLQADETQTEQSLQALNPLLQKREIESLAALPEMNDPDKLAAMELLSLLFVPVYFTQPKLLPLLCSTMVHLSLQFGNAPTAPIGYIGYGVVLCSHLDEVEAGYRLGCLAVRLLEKFNNANSKSLVLLLFNAFIHHRKEALKSTMTIAKQAYLSDMETGNFVCAGYNISNYFDQSFFSGVCLNDWGEEIEQYCQVVKRIKQTSALTLLEMAKQAYFNLQQRCERPDLLSGENYDETAVLAQYREGRESLMILLVYSYKLLLAYFFGLYSYARDYIAAIQDDVQTLGGMFYTPAFHFYAGLTYLAQYSTLSETERAKALDFIKNQRMALRDWAERAPMNYQHKLELFDAETCRVLGKKGEAIDLYDRAIAGAKTNEYLQEEALANELAAKFYVDWGKREIAKAYLLQAYYAYARWGAKGKTDQLERLYPDFLTGILQEQMAASSTAETLFRIQSLTTVQQVSTQSSPESSSNIFAHLDLATVLKASQTLSNEIELDRLLTTLLDIVLQNAGADKAALLMPQEQEWSIEALANLEQVTQIASMPLAEFTGISQGIVGRVRRSREAVVIEDARSELTLAADDYIQQHQPKSVLCMPILNQGNLEAILYLENRVTAGVFTSNLVQILHLLCTQAAISLKNARLYQQAARSQELERAYQELQDTQLQLIQAEKMSSLGQLVAGIAHEINNPISFIYSNVQHLSNYTQQLLEIIEFYQLQYPTASPEIAELLEDADLDFVAKDIVKTIGSMQTGAARIRDIVKSLRTFSRLDESEVKAVDLHENIESTLVLLQNRLIGSGGKPDITVIKNYGNLPKFECCIGLLNQVFMNLVMNAIQAIEERQMSESDPQYRGIITITTVRDSPATLSIAVRDNGIGMTPEVQARIFNPFFTAKPIGMGKGMGLPISYQIVTKNHQGKLEVDSVFGQGTTFTMRLPVSRV